MTQASSKKRRNRKENLKFSDGTVLKIKTSNAGSIRQKQGRGIHRHPEQKLDTELPQAPVDVKDQYDDLEYPPPSRNKSFREIWGRGIKNISDRENFDPSHLTLFETYCSLLVTLRRLDQFVMENGHTFRITTVTGEVRRTHPEIAERNKTISQIAMYAKLLDLLPKKDKNKTVKPEQETDWA